jgi:Spy/CpxP family protein refolding chaperone
MINKQNRSKVFIAIIAILLVANIAMVSFFLMKKDGARREKKPEWKTVISGFLKTEIGFDTVQLKQYDSLSNRHKDNMKKMTDSLRTTKDKQFKELAAANFSDSAMNTVADRSAATQKAMELRMFNHLKKIRLLCTPEQQPKFDSLFGKVLNRRGGENKKSKEIKDK